MSSQPAKSGTKLAASSAAKAWKDDNREAVIAANDYVERHGLPLRRFSHRMDAETE